jgi:hypothetical protein
MTAMATTQQISMYKLDPTAPRPERRASANSTFAIGGVSCSADSFMVAETSTLRINICAEKPAHRKSAKRYPQTAFEIKFESYV